MSIKGLEFANDTVSPFTNFIISAGKATDDTGSQLLELPVGISKNLSASWSAGDGGGALDTGSVGANLWYHVFLIGNPMTGDIDVLASGSVSNPVMPSCYTLKRRIFSVLTDGSAHIVPMLQTGDYFEFVKPIIFLSHAYIGGNVVNTHAVTVPIGLKVDANLNILTNGPATGTKFVSIADPDLGAIDITNFVAYQCGNWIASRIRCFTDVMGRILSFSNADTAGQQQMSGWTLGFRDMRA